MSDLCLSRLLRVFLLTKLAYLLEDVAYLNFQFPSFLPEGNKQSSTPIEDKGTPTPGVPRVFATNVQPEHNVDGEQSDSRHVPARRHVETVGEESQKKKLTVDPGGVAELMRCNSTSEQERSNGQRSSDMVTSRPRSESNLSPGPLSQKSFVEMLSSTLSLLTREKDEKTDMGCSLQKKKEKLQELKARKEKVEGFLTEKEEKISRLEGEARRMQSGLDEERTKREESQDALGKNERKIKWLEDDVYQKQRELEQEKEEKHEKCEELTELEKQLQQAHIELEREKLAKDGTMEELGQASKRIEALQKDVAKANNEVEITLEEREKVRRVLAWTEGDLQEEKDEVNELNSMLKRQKEVMTTYRTIMVFLFAILTGLALYSMGILQ